MFNSDLFRLICLNFGFDMKEWFIDCASFLVNFFFGYEYLSWKPKLILRLIIMYIMLNVNN